MLQAIFRQILMDGRILEYQCDLQFGQYENGNTAIQLFDTKTGEPVGKITVNPLIPDRPGCIWVKDYQENTGMTESMIKSGIIKREALGECEVGNGLRVILHELTDAAKAELERVR